MKTCFITGGAGFIGSWLCEDLLKKNYRVICIDNLSTGSEKNIAHLIENKNFTFIKHDITKYLDFDHPVDFLFHFASPASPSKYQKLELETALVNSVGTLNMLELARKKGSVFLLASTSETYGDPKEHPQKETYWGHVNPVGIRSCYDESKRFAETLTTIYKNNGLSAKIVRIFNTYGPRMDPEDGRAVPNFIMHALKNKPITINGDGKQTRSFCYISDMVDVIEKVAFSKSNEIFNIGNPEEYTIIQLAKTVKNLARSKSDIIFREMPQDDPVKRRPDISKIKRILGWEPSVKLEEGLTKTIQWYRENIA